MGSAADSLANRRGQMPKGGDGTRASAVARAMHGSVATETPVPQPPPKPPRRNPVSDIIGKLTGQEDMSKINAEIMRKNAQNRGARALTKMMGR